MLHALTQYSVELSFTRLPGITNCASTVLSQLAFVQKCLAHKLMQIAALFSIYRRMTGD